MHRIRFSTSFLFMVICCQAVLPGCGGKSGKPPMWETTVGIQAVIPEVDQVTLLWNGAADANNPPVKYNVYWDTAWPFDFESVNVLKDVEKSEGAAYDWQYTVTGLERGTDYWFVIRVEDSFDPANEDFNTVAVRGTPLYDTTAPAWDSTAGIQAVEGGDGRATVYWNGATDAHTPRVRYNVYWDTYWPFDFDSANVREDVAPFPDSEYDWKFTVGGLENGIEYWFAVRAADSEEVFNEDKNTKVLSYTPAAKEWRCELVDDIGNVGHYSSLALDGNGNPAIAYHDNTNFALKYASFDGAAWTIESLDLVPAYYPQLAFGPDGEPYVACLTHEGGDLYFISRGEVGWDFEWISEAGSVLGSGQHSLALDHGGSPVISFSGHYEDKGLKIARRTAGTWEVQIVDPTCDGRGNSLAFDAEGNPWISYVHVGGFPDFSIKIAYHDGDKWIIDDVDPDGSLAFTTDLVFSPNGEPLVAFDKDDGLVRRLALARLLGGSWSIEIVDDVHEGLFPSLQISPDGHPAISYDDMEKLYFARFDGQAWNIETLCLEHGVRSPFDSSLVFGPDGLPMISHFMIHDVYHMELRLARANWSP